MDKISKKEYSPDEILDIFQPENITYAEVLTAAKVLNAIALFHPKHKVLKVISKAEESSSNVKETYKKRTREESLKLYQDPSLRSVRKALGKVFELHKLQLYNGESEENYYAYRIAERTLKRRKMAEQLEQKKYIGNTKLRRGRIEKLEKLKMESKEEEEKRLKVQALMIPDGHVDTEGDVKMLLEDSANVDGSNESTNADDNNTSEGVKLPKLRSCYVCKVRFRELHSFYDQLCPSCAKLNFEKRHNTEDLTGKVAVVTGSRVKIGFQVCLKLLRAGCKVVATTRFPNSAAATYMKEKNFNKWKDNLDIYGLDLRDVIGLEAFTRYLKMKFGDKGIDILINNACQTVRRPTAYYTPLVEREVRLWKESGSEHKALLDSCLEFEGVRRKLLVEEKKTNKSIASTIMPSESDREQEDKTTHEKSEDGKSSLVTTDSSSVQAPFETTGLSHSAAMSQMVILPDDAGVSQDILPDGFSDINGHQIDLRKTNSWLMKMDQVSTPELMECMFINAIAPFVLNSRLQPIMTTPSDSRPDRYIINVSAMEGKFYRYKMPNHPHTNMAKASLNMMTRTAAEDLAKKHRIFMNSVDTGWINDENPLDKASKTAEKNNFQTPIDEIDAAARICDPIFIGVRIDLEKHEDESKKCKPPCKDYGKFLKDYRETEW